MPERQIVILPEILQGDGAIGHFNDLLSKGWQLDRNVHNGVVPLQNAAIYHLIKYTPEEITALQQARMQEQEEKKAFSLKAASLISVPLAEVDAKLKEGYEIVPDKIYAKEAILVKWQQPVVKEENPAT